jgi:hypothetical protein
MIRSQSWIIVLGLTAVLVLDFLQKTYRWIQFRRGELKQVWAKTTASVTTTNRIKDGIEVKMWYEAEGRRFDVEGVLEERDVLPTTIPLVYKIGKPETWDYAEDRTIGAEEFVSIAAWWMWFGIIAVCALGIYVYVKWFVKL